MATIKVNEDNFEAEVMKSDKPVVMDFGASWCGPCQMIEPVLEELSSEMTDVKIVKISTEQSPKLAQLFGVRGIPTLIVMKNGKEINRIVGFMPKGALQQQIRNILE